MLNRQQRARRGIVAVALFRGNFLRREIRRDRYRSGTVLVVGSIAKQVVSGSDHVHHRR